MTDVPSDAPADDPERPWVQPYTELPDPVEENLGPIFVDNVRVKGGTGMSASDPNNLIGVTVFEFWNSANPEFRFELTFLGRPETMRSAGDTIRGCMRHVANRLEGKR